ncbi:hypothetical protein ACM7XV_21125 [Pseudomonas aeruginosa]
MSNELTDVRCPCGAEFQADSYDAGFIAGSGMCQNCDAALPPKDICTCPSGDGSLRHPCPAHPESVELAGVTANLTFINGRPAMCGCQVEYSSGGGEYSDVIYVTLCAKHSGSAILDLVATNRIALTPEYEGQWHADLYLDREIPLAKAEGATPAEAVLALMSAERIDPEQGGVDQAGGDRWDALQSIMEWTAAENIPDDRKLCLIRNAARAALAQPSPVRSSLLINGYQLRAALDFIAPDGTAEQLESEACIEWRQQDADFLEAGLYAFCAEYPEEGGVLLDEEPTTAQPSPLQSEQAEAERPEVVAWRNRMIDPPQSNPGWKLVTQPEGKPWLEEEPLTTVAQHERIVGALRAEIAEWQEAAGRGRSDVVAYIAERAKLLEERDAALARVAELEGQSGVEFVYDSDELVAVPRGLLGAACHAIDKKRDAPRTIAKLREYARGLPAPVAQAQHSVPEGWMLVECGIWTQEQVDEMQKTVARFRNSEFVDDRALAMAVADAGQCKAPEISLAELLAAAPGKEGL